MRNQLRWSAVVALWVIIINVVLSFFAVFIGSSLPLSIKKIIHSFIPFKSGMENWEEWNVVILVIFSAVWLYQLLYVIPVIVWCIWKRNFVVFKGVIIGAVITTLVSGRCFVNIIRVATNN